MGSVIGYESINGNIASFKTDVAEKIKNLKINIEPVQNLHGYNNPWPEGGGKNLLKVTATTQTKNGVEFTVNSDGTVTANGTASADTTLTLAYIDFASGSFCFNGAPSGADKSSYFIRVYNTSSQISKKCTGSDVTFTGDEGFNRVDIRIYSGVTVNNVVFKPMIRLSSVSDATFAPYSNICPITGWSGASVARTGKNLFDAANYPFTQGTWISGVTGGTSTSPNFACTMDYIPVSGIAGETITLNKRSGGYIPGLAFYDTSKAYVSGISNNSETAGTPMTFTIPNNAAYLRFTVPAGATDIQLEAGSTATDYEPYQGETYDIAFPVEAGEIYGGTLDVITGELVVNRMIKVLDGSVVDSISELPPGQQGTTHLYKVNESYFLLKVEDYSKDYITNLFGTDTARFSTDRIGSYVYNKTLRFRLPESIADTPETVRAWLANNPLQIMYPLDEPITYQLTPLEIQTIIGTNNIYADTGDTSVIYPKTITPIETMSNVNLMELRKNIIAAQANDNLYDKWIWQQNKNDFIVRNNTAGFLEGVGNNIYLDQRENAENNRLNVSTKRGKVPLVLYNSTEGGSSTPIKLYPIPIPVNANNVQISSDVEDGEYGTVVVRLVNGAYKQMKLNPSWIKNNPKLYFVTGKNHYLVPYIRRAANADFITMPQNVQLTFSYGGQWRWTLTEENLALWKRNSYWDNTNSKICFYSSTNVNNYLTMCVFDGFCGYWYFDQPESMHNHAPIPIPPTATKVTVTTTPSLQAHLILLKCFDNQTQQFISDNGWKSTPLTMTFNADDNLELAVTLRVNSAVNDFTDSTKPTEIIVQFE